MPTALAGRPLAATAPRPAPTGPPDAHRSPRSPPTPPPAPAAHERTPRGTRFDALATPATDGSESAPRERAPRASIDLTARSDRTNVATEGKTAAECTSQALRSARAGRAATARMATSAGRLTAATGRARRHLDLLGERCGEGRISRRVVILVAWQRISCDKYSGGHRGDTHLAGLRPLCASLEPGTGRSTR